MLTFPVSSLSLGNANIKNYISITFAFTVMDSPSKNAGEGKEISPISVSGILLFNDR